MEAPKTLTPDIRPKVIDLFCGCGGFSLGAARAGFNVVAGVDLDSHAIATHKRNFRKSRHLELDLAKTGSDELMQLAGIKADELSGIIGGPPCQGFSAMGSNNTDDPRNKLFNRFFELVAEISPDFFVCENVPGLLRANYDPIRAEALKIVDDEYLVIGPMKLKASDYGAPTIRTRAFFVGTKRKLHLSLKAEDFLPDLSIPTTNVGRALAGLPRKISEKWQDEDDGWRKINTQEQGDYFYKRLGGLIPPGLGDRESKKRLKEDFRVSGCLGTVHQTNVITRFSAVPGGKSDKISRAPRLALDGFCPTLRAGTGSDRGSYQAVRPIHPTENRVITPREAARLQGFPDWFRFDRTKWHSFRQIGNSVSPLVSEFILRVISKQINKY